MRIVLLVVAIAFFCGVAALAIANIVRHGVTPIDVVGILLVALMSVPIVGALLSRNGEDINAQVAEGQARRRLWSQGNRI